ncbi:MAG: L-threonylcarbamoyladenylate synthase [Patescibacteria group bacterium]
MTNKNQIIKILEAGGIGVMPTDTIYGLVGQALNKKTVERLYSARRRNPEKPLIILISSYGDLELLGIEPGEGDKDILKRFWPGQVSVILPCRLAKLKYLHRGTETLAVRLPAKKWLRDLIKQTGPLVAPSANPEGVKSADNLAEAQDYFGDQIDFYYGPSATLHASKPSTLVKLENGKIEILRQGAVKI